MPSHLPVLLKETIEILQPQRGGVFLDGTLGLGGHTEALLAAGATQVVGIDQDMYALEMARERLANKAVTFVHANFGDLEWIAKEEHLPPLDGILLDIGVSSYQIDTPERGFSFMHDGPLDMRMDNEGDVTAKDIVNRMPERNLADLIYQYGEERLSRKIARFIAERRVKQPFETTADLAYVIAGAFPPHARHKAPHPATRTFQALRIAVNKELEVLERGMAAGVELLAPGGIFAIITFHSLEDRIVKHGFRERAMHDERFEVLTKKAIIPSDEECAENSRSRSAKLRALRRLS